MIKPYFSLPLSAACPRIDIPDSTMRPLFVVSVPSLRSKISNLNFSPVF